MRGIHLNGAELSYDLIKYALEELEEMGVDLYNLTLVVADEDSIIPLTDTYVTTANEIYHIPYVLPDEDLTKYLLEKISKVVHKIEIMVDLTMVSDVAIIVHNKGIYRFTA